MNAFGNGIAGGAPTVVATEAVDWTMTLGVIVLIALAIERRFTLPVSP